MVSVISSSPLQDGFIRFKASKTLSLKTYTPIRAHSLIGSLGFSTILFMVSSVLKATTPYLLGSFTFATPPTKSDPDSLKRSTKGLTPCLRRLSPRYMTKGSPLRYSSEIFTAWASPFGSGWSIYVMFTPWFDPSPKVSTTPSLTGPRIMQMSLIPAFLRCSNPCWSMGLLAMGSMCLLPVNVRGLSLVPCPPARRRPFMFIHLSLMFLLLTC